MPGGGTYRGVYTKLIDDLDYQALSADARLALLTLRLCAQNTAASIFRYYPEVLRFQTGLSSERLDAALAELERSPCVAAPWIFREGPVVWIRNGLRHDPSMKLGHQNHRAAVEKAIGGLPRLEIVARFCDYYRLPKPSWWLANGLAVANEGVSPPSPIPIPNTDVMAKPSERHPEAQLCVAHGQPPETCVKCAADAERFRQSRASAIPIGGGSDRRASRYLADVVAGLRAGEGKG